MSNETALRQSEAELRKLVPENLWDEFQQFIQTGKASRRLEKRIDRSPELQRAVTLAMIADIRDLIAFGGTLRESWPKDFCMSRDNDLTQAEIDHVNRHHTCPDCQEGEFLEGPWGGSTVNVKCDCIDCGQEFWLGVGAGKAWTGGRIDRNDPGLYHSKFQWPKPPKMRKLMKLLKIVVILGVLAAIGLVAYLFTIP